MTDQEIIKAATPEQIEVANRIASERMAEAEKPAPKFIGTESRSATVTLKYPMEYDGVIYKTITLSRISGAQLQNLNKQDGDPAIALMHLLTGVPHRVLEALDAEDFAEINVVGADFLPRRLMEAAEQNQSDGQDTQQT
jgi:hypothetical protein